jgi:uncharacterized protein (TIGR02001 family)
MKKLMIVSAVAAAFAAPAAIAQSTGTASASPHTVTGNIAVVSDYRFRGISQTFGKPALQGGFDYAHTSGLYLGNWNSNVSETAGFPGGNIEMDFYGGWKKSFGDFGADVGLLYYYYPGSEAAGTNSVGRLANPNSTKTTSGTVHNTEVYVAGSWKFLTLKYSRALTDYFLVPDTKGSHYLDLTATHDLGNGWSVNGHVGRLGVRNFSDANYTDYKLGVTKDLGGWLLGASYVSTNARDNCAGSGNQPYCFTKVTGAGTKTYEGGKNAVVLSASRAF